MQGNRAPHMIMIMRDPFSGLFRGARSIGVSQGAALFSTGAPVSEIFRVRTGRVLLQRNTASGTLLTLQTATAGMILAEASAYSDFYHCDAVAADAGTIVEALPKTRFRAALAADLALAEAWAGMLARGVQAARFKAEIRSLTKVADRLDAWLDAGNTLPEKGRLQEVAAELSVTREALYRELARRRTAVGAP